MICKQIHGQTNPSHLASGEFVGKGRSNVRPKLPHQLLRWWSLPRFNLSFGKLGSNWPPIHFSREMLNIFSSLCVRDKIWQYPAPGTGTLPFLSMRFIKWSLFSSNDWDFYGISHCQVCFPKHILFNRHSMPQPPVTHCTLPSAPWCKILELVHSGPGMAGGQQWGYTLQQHCGYCLLWPQSSRIGIEKRSMMSVCYCTRTVPLLSE